MFTPPPIHPLVRSISHRASRLAGLGCLGRLGCLVGLAHVLVAPRAVAFAADDPPPSPAALGAALPAQDSGPGLAFDPASGSDSIPRRGRVSLSSGLAAARFVGVEVSHPPLPMISVTGLGTAWRGLRDQLELGAQGHLLVVPWAAHSGGGPEGTSLIWSASLLAGWSRTMERWLLGAHVGVGLATWKGLGAGHPFGGDDGSSRTWMPTASLGAEAAYRVWSHVFVGLSPRLSSSAPVGETKAGVVRRCDELGLGVAVSALF